jgi:hypothetical protein
VRSGSRKKTTKNKPQKVEVKKKPKTNLKKTTPMVSNEKKWTAMNPIWCRMKKCSPSSG